MPTATPKNTPNWQKDLHRARLNHRRWLESTGKTVAIWRPALDSEGIPTGPEPGEVVPGYEAVPCAITYTPLGSMGEPMNNTTRRRTEMSIPGGTSRMTFAHPEVGGPDIHLKDWFRSPDGTVYIAGVVHTEDPDGIDQEVEVEVRRIPR